MLSQDLGDRPGPGTGQSGLEARGQRRRFLVAEVVLRQVRCQQGQVRPRARVGSRKETELGQGKHGGRPSLAEVLPVLVGHMYGDLVQWTANQLGHPG